MGDQRTKGGSLFSLGAVPSDALPHFLQTIRRHKSRRRLGQILEAIFGLCADSDDGLVDRNTLCDFLDITRSGLLANLTKLEELGILTRSEVRPDSKRRRVVLYQLDAAASVLPTDADLPDLFDDHILDIADADMAKREEKDALLEMFRRPDSVTCMPKAAEKTTFKGERLSVFTLAPAMNVGRQEVTSKTTRLWHGTRSFEVTVRALTGHRIPNVQDLRPLVVAWTLARDQLPHLGESAPSHPVFMMSMTDICGLLGFKNPNANNKRQTFNRLRRFRSSEWQLTDDRYNVLRRLRKGGLLERDKYMSFISDLEVISSVSAHGKTPEMIAITFHPAFTPVLTDMERSLTLHKEFIQGKYREFDQLVYQWCRTHVQHKHEPTEFPLERVHREAHPSIPFVRFRNGLERMVEDPCYESIPDADYPMTLIPGYVLALDVSQNKLVASARTSDPHLGTTSKFALAKKDQPRAAKKPGAASAVPSFKPARARPAGAENKRSEGPSSIGDVLKTLATKRNS